jgi:hypothetical protein
MTMIETYDAAGNLISIDGEPVVEIVSDDSDPVVEIAEVPDSFRAARMRDLGCTDGNDYAVVCDGEWVYRGAKDECEQMARSMRASRTADARVSVEYTA